MDFDAETEATLDQIPRFLPPDERAAAREAAVYTILMTETDLTPGASVVASWCYEYASLGIPHHQWPDLVALRARDPEAGSDAAEQHARVRRDSIAQGLIERGEA